MTSEKREEAGSVGASRQAALHKANVATRTAMGALFILYPVFVYYALKSGGMRRAALLLLAIYLPIALIRFLWGKRARFGALQLVPLIPLGTIGLASLLSSPSMLLATPTIINWSLLAVFGGTLFTERPMIERFAHLVDPHLSEPRRRWCRLWTWIWCAFFTLNGAVAGALALLDDPIYWAAYTSVLSYVLMALLFGGEMGLRFLRFGSLRERRQ